MRKLDSRQQTADSRQQKRENRKRLLSPFLASCFLLLASRFLLLASLCSADTVASKNAKANRQYYEKNYEEALKTYKDAQLDAPDSAPLHFNTGNALYKLERYDEAKEEYRHATGKDVTLRANGYYNLGNTLFRQSRFDEAIAAYKQVLRLHPNDLDAKHNLELAYLKLQEQQQQREQQQKDQKDKDKDNQQDTQEQKADKERQQEQEQEAESRSDQSRQDGSVKRQPGQMSKEEAMRLLEALKDREAEQRRLRREKVSERRVRGKDW